MKTHLALVMLAFGMLPASADQADVYYKQGMQAASRGDVAAARNAFNEALRLKPNHPYARYQLGQLKNTQGDMVAKQRAERLAGVVLPEINFNEVALSDALMALGTMVETETKKVEGEEPFIPNFMIKDPAGKLGEREVSLQLKGIPAKVALDYLLEQAGATARFDAHATVIRPTAVSGG